MGSRSTPITTMYVGEGGRSNSPGNILLAGTQADGTDIAAGNFTIGAGAGSGTGIGGHLLFQTAPASLTPGTAVNALVTRMEITDDGVIIFSGIVNTSTNGVATTDATLTTAHIFPTVSDTSYTITSTCTMQSSSAANGGLVIRSAFKNVGGTVTIVGATQAVSTFEENAATAVAHVISGTDILTRVTGIAAVTIEWNCGVTFVEAS